MNIASSLGRSNTSPENCNRRLRESPSQPSPITGGKPWCNKRWIIREWQILTYSESYLLFVPQQAINCGGRGDEPLRETGSNSDTTTYSAISNALSIRNRRNNNSELGHKTIGLPFNPWMRWVNWLTVNRAVIFVASSSKKKPTTSDPELRIDCSIIQYITIYYSIL